MIPASGKPAPNKSGHPVECPAAQSLRRLTVDSILGEKVGSILRRCGAPESWGNKEIKLLVYLGIFRHLSDLETFNRMLAIAPDALMKALPKVLKVGRDALQHPVLRIVLEQALANGGPLPGLWDGDAKELAEKFDRAFQLGRTADAKLPELLGQALFKPLITARHIEDARAAIRKYSQES
jgi:hypothetical protein